ncbi:MULTISPECIES: M28 family peptidase [Roseivirga]|uniref:M28 family peptidase n=1 Tax=Roseivirga TaxID=290180 RepID=UPI001B08E0C5|nr:MULTISPECIES: M28 family peptidase [Roseivirga]MBO6662569.1 M28 family peptidase [Roseivirga sp.]MBO6761505.1 M28 family peptidase [Roseivirga sp.]MBO6909576.1 M28 family peptidase [Roseivirga sp.]WPZ11044.1 M28 family peptidase [Roseivirga spongicola]
MKKTTILFFVLVLVFGCTPKKDDQATIFKKINEEALANSVAYENLEEATKTIGHRLTGSPEGAKAEEFTYNLFKSYGLEVEYQPFEVESWSRGEIEVQIGSKNKLEEMPAVTLAHSPVEADITAEIVDMGNGVDADYEANPDAVKGKIALVYIGTLPNSPEGTPGLHRSEKTALATKYGAIGIIIINQVDGGVLLTGTASVTGSLITIPAVCIGKENGMELKETLKKSKQYASIKMTNESGLINARNVIATIKGSELPEEKVIVGGHLDSWDLATGAIDNGIGSFAIIDMARTFAALDLKPKRTVQFVMFMGEEEGLLGSRYMVDQAIENGTINQIKYIMNQDMSGNPAGFGTGGRPEAEAFFKEVGKEIMAIDSTTYKNVVSNGAGLHSDHQPFMLQGIPYTSPASRLDRAIYGCYHADCDDFDLVNKEHMVNNVRFSSMMLYALADADQLPAQKLNDAETKAFLEGHNLKLKLQIGGDWRWED